MQLFPVSFQRKSDRLPSSFTNSGNLRFDYPNAKLYDVCSFVIGNCMQRRQKPGFWFLRSDNPFNGNPELQRVAPDWLLLKIQLIPMTQPQRGVKFMPPECLPWVPVYSPSTIFLAKIPRLAHFTRYCQAISSFRNASCHFSSSASFLAFSR